MAILAFGGKALNAFGRDDNIAAWFHDLRGGGHAFDGLIQIEVERITAVGCYYDVKGFGDALHSNLARKFATCVVTGIEVACENSGNVQVAVECDVVIEGDNARAIGRWMSERESCRVSQFFPQGIAVRDAPMRVRRGD